MNKRPLLRPALGHANTHMPAGARRRGFALLEVLVALLITAIGVLGVVGLQGAMTRAQTSTTFRGEAAYLAQQLIGGMWVDRNNLATYATANCGARCADWQDRVASRLPGGTSTVTVNAATGVVTIEIRWTAPGEASNRFTTATTIVNS
jgi:type IV pilus assembly protein PilV